MITNRNLENFEMQRRHFMKLAGATACGALLDPSFSPAIPSAKGADPTECKYAPPGEYIKDHTFVRRDGWWHLYSISGVAGLAWLYSGNEESLSWSISRDLKSWELRGHIMHPSQRENTYDQDMVWAPYCLQANNRYYMYYAGCVQARPLQYDKRGTFGKIQNTPNDACSIGLAVSDDLTRWTKVSDAVKGLGVPGRDPNVVRDEKNGRWLMYTTGAEIDGLAGAYVSESNDLLNWKVLRPCAKFPRFPKGRQAGYTVDCLSEFGSDTSESLTVKQHPITKQWIMMGNWHYILSDDPTDFLKNDAQLYNLDFHGKTMDIGFAGEIIESDGKWYRSGVIGPLDRWRLALTEIEWVPEGSFRIVKPSILSGSWGPHKAGTCSSSPATS
jgi:hypothetical protein